MRAVTQLPDDEAWRQRRALQDIDERDIVFEAAPDVVGPMQYIAAEEVATVQAQSTVTTESNAPWAMDRLDQISRPLDQLYSYGTDGSGVDGECCGICKRGCVYYAVFVALMNVHGTTIRCLM